MWRFSKQQGNSSITLPTTPTITPFKRTRLRDIHLCHLYLNPNSKPNFKALDGGMVCKYPFRPTPAKWPKTSCTLCYTCSSVPSATSVSCDSLRPSCSTPQPQHDQELEQLLNPLPCLLCSSKNRLTSCALYGNPIPTAKPTTMSSGYRLSLKEPSSKLTS